MKRQNGKASRREFLRSAAAAPLALSTIQRLSAMAGIRHLYDGLQSIDFFEGEVRVETRVPDDTFFTEGPAVSSHSSVFFTNIPVSKIYRWEPASRKLELFREDTGKANGLLFDGRDRLYACEQERGRVVRIDTRTGDLTVIADQFRGEPLEAPNDLVFDRSGNLYFSSRPTSDVPSRGGTIGVYRVKASGEIERILEAPDVHMPNGLVLSPDEKMLYLVEAHPDENHNRHIRVYPISEEGKIGRHKILIDFYPGRSGDGMCIDSRGNLYVAAGLHKRRGTSETLDTRPGVHVISPEGRLLAYAEVPVDTISNCTFGGRDRKTLYITSGPFLLSVRTKIAG